MFRSNQRAKQRMHFSKQSHEPHGHQSPDPSDLQQQQLCRKCIPLAPLRNASNVAHDYDAYPHNPSAWVNGTRVFFCSCSFIGKWSPMRWFLSRNDLQLHLDHEHSTTRLCLGVQWCHEGTRFTERGSVFENSGKWCVLCPEIGCAFIKEICSIEDECNHNTSSISQHARTHHKNFWGLDLGDTGKLVNRMKCTRWMCPRSDCQKIFHRHADFLRHLPTHDSSQRDFPCSAEGCERRDPNGFSRMDHLRNHTRAKHPSLVDELMKPKQRRRRQQKEKARLH